MKKNSTDPLLQAALDARLHDPFSYLGLHRQANGWELRLLLPRASRVELFTDHWEAVPRRHEQGFFVWNGYNPPPRPTRLRFELDGQHIETWDAYQFGPTLSDHDLYLFNEGRLLQNYRMLGAHPLRHEGVAGVRFAVWAPNAERVSVVGDFNRWDGRQHPMRSRGSSGVWELFVPGIPAGTLYKFEIRNRHHGGIMVKTDPFGFAFEMRPGTAARICERSRYDWGDDAWMTARARSDWLHAPMNVYEVHLGSWKHTSGGGFPNFRDIVKDLLPYARDMGFTHLELLPVSEHPLDESWGYQTTGYFGVTSRYGTPDDFRHFVDQCHQAGMGVILDWVPGHFPKDDFALARFDGSALYEHEDPRLGEHQDWGTYIFNYGRSEVRGFLVGNAHFWLSEFHLDGLRVDAVASMLYLDYSRKPGEWLPNAYGGRENLDALSFLRDVNVMVHEQFPGALTVAEESTAWPMVSRPVYLGGLGFSMKWNMGWMNDTLRYFSRDPLFRRHHHHDLTFGQLYAYSENFVLPFSHDEVVHGKKSLLDKMPGDVWQRFANLRLLLCYQMTYPGKKLNFMGNEFGHGSEWQVKSGLDWSLLETHWHQGVQKLCRDLNRLYQNRPELHDLDFEPSGFRWLECDDADQSVLSYQRLARDGRSLLVILNLTPVPRPGYRLGLPAAGCWRELVNTDSTFYGGGDLGNGGTPLQSRPHPWNGAPCSLSLTLPPLAGLILESC
ncbi:MAG: 1,4-alpha-glucan branching protein GlgB [Betaproteobacteria bacterium]|nr:1,4-alpha-glucan branching protein GlgB [Betaproteobacteria bacterium]MDE2131146.1 1,4-alpha-glucan branching protein GlgB [Betaproteobacteria bacterium]MDE2211245.1 1,4-alpha-glucan branching protein GlgB [Betaproteobacteria bacterium]